MEFLNLIWQNAFLIRMPMLTAFILITDAACALLENSTPVSYKK
jgi:hypothetical protein